MDSYWTLRFPNWSQVRRALQQPSLGCQTEVVRLSEGPAAFASEQVGNPGSPPLAGFPATGGERSITG